jgi:hypothetical protein
VNPSNTENNFNEVSRHLDGYVPSKAIELQNPNTFANRWPRFLLCLAIIALHMGAIVWMNKGMVRSDFSQNAEVVTILEFVTIPKPKPVSQDDVIDKANDKPIQPSLQRPAVSKKPLMEHDSKTPNRPSSAAAVQSASTSSTENTKRPIRVYDSSGKVHLDPTFVENFDKQNQLPQRFDFRNPNFELAGTFLKRPPAMAFEPTQFEQAWKPDQDVLTELLTKAVEKTTAEVKIPVPGNPTVKMVCQVSMLALGGACGFVPNGGYGRVVPDSEDDPNTLSPKELAACQAWWNKIIDTRSQREWFKTKDLYERECKKPIAKEKSWPK